MQVILRTVERDGVPTNEQEVVSELLLDRREEALALLEKSHGEFHIKVRKISELQTEAKDVE